MPIRQKSYESAISAYGLAIAGATEADMKHTDAAVRLFFHLLLLAAFGPPF